MDVGSTKRLGNHLSKVNPLTILGVVIALTGLAGPWFSFYMIEYDGGNYWNVEISPFTLKTTVTSHYIGYFISSSNHYFYKADTSLIGLACILGGILSFFGGCTGRWKVNLAGGVIILLSTLSFPMCLPERSLPGFSTCWGSTVSLYGAIIIISSLSLPYLLNLGSDIRFALSEIKMGLNATIKWIIFDNALPQGMPPFRDWFKEHYRRYLVSKSIECLDLDRERPNHGTKNKHELMKRTLTYISSWRTGSYDEWNCRLSNRLSLPPSTIKKDYLNLLIKERIIARIGFQLYFVGPPRAQPDSIITARPPL